MARVGVCSWSLRPTGPADLVEKVRLCGLSAVQLALDPIRRGEWPEEQTVRLLGDAGIGILSGMMGMEGEDYSTLESIRRTGGVRPDETWERNLAAARENAQIAHRLGLRLVTFHGGFLPHEGAGPTEKAERHTMVQRLRELAAVFATWSVKVGLETGQEDAPTLIGVLNDLGKPVVGVNFDPANMILYGMGDPVAALQRLAPWVRQVHVKDARASKVPGQWGAEVPVGDGQVDWPGFFGVLRGAGLDVDLVVEREAGHSRVDDVRRAGMFVQEQLPSARP
jgi:L-ribulose-5-phosphate 3-epimerase